MPRKDWVARQAHAIPTRVDQSTSGCTVSTAVIQSMERERRRLDGREHRLNLSIYNPPVQETSSPSSLQGILLLLFPTCM